MSEPKVVKVTFNLTEDEYKILADIAHERGTNVTSILRHAVHAEKLLSDVKNRGEMLLIKKNDGHVDIVNF